MEEIIEEKVDGSTVRIRKVDWTYFRKDELEAMRDRMEIELGKVNSMLATINST